MKKTILILVSIIFIGCNSNEDEPNSIPFVPITISPLNVGKGDLNGSEEVNQQNINIDNNTDWSNLKNQIDAQYITMGLGNYFTDNIFTETNIDFQNFTLIAAFDQIYGNGGHSIDIINIVEYETNIVVTVQNLQTGNLTTVMTQPFHIVKIPITTKPIVFEEL